MLLAAAAILVCALAVGALNVLGLLPAHPLAKATLVLLVGVGTYFVLRLAWGPGPGTREDHSLYAPELSTLAFPPSTYPERRK